MPTKKKSKRYGLGKLDPQWRQKIFDSIKSERFKLAIAVLSATGCRPVELESGVILHLVEDHIQIGIRGAKVDTTTRRGQPLRLLRIDSGTPWGEYLREHLLRADRNLITVKYDAGSLSQRLREKSKVLWPRQKTLISAYSYRHFLGKSMKESGEDPVKIASTLGHASDYSQTCYGRAGGGKRSSGQHGVISAVATNPIRHSSKCDKVSKMITCAELKRWRGS